MRLTGARLTVGFVRVTMAFVAAVSCAAGCGRLGFDRLDSANAADGGGFPDAWPADGPTLDAPTLDGPTLDAPTADGPSPDAPNLDAPNLDASDLDALAGDACSSPDGAEGTLRFNGFAPEVCDGTRWVPLRRIDGWSTDRGAVAVGGAHTCAIRSDGVLFCWGLGSDGQLGLGAASSEPLPVAVSAPPEGWARVAATETATCGTLTSGAVYCWGNDDYGQIADGVLGLASASPVAVDSGPWSSVIMGAQSHVCGLLSDQRVRCWGQNTYGQFGEGAVGGLASLPVPSSAMNTTQMAAGFGHTCAIDASGRLSCWGRDSYGQLGDDVATSDRYLPSAVAGGFSDWSSISAGYEFTCGVRSGDAYCWGGNDTGALGDGTLTPRALPQLVAGGFRDWDQVACGRFHTCGLRRDGSIGCWGDNGAGQLGTGDTVRQLSPATTAGGVRDWVSLAEGSAAAHTCAVRQTGELYCWGANGDGQVGVARSADVLTPTRVVVPTASSACVAPPASAGDLAYDVASRRLRYCDGRLWLDTQPPPPNDCAGGCVAPSGSEGDVRYDAAQHALVYCNGSCWVTVGE